MSVSAATAVNPLSAINLLNTNTIKVKANSAAGSTTTGGTAAGAGLGSTTAGTTFLNLLVKELQNQDPTAPMDSTAMVGQMISLNQLDQLISINQTLGAVTSSTPTKTGHAVQSTNAAESASSLMAARAALMSSASPSSSIDAASTAASDPTTTLDLSKFNMQFGGK